MNYFGGDWSYEIIVILTGSKDILGYSDTVGTREKCCSTQIFVYSDTFW